MSLRVKPKGKWPRLALTPGPVVGDSELGAAGAAIQQGQIAPGGIAGSGHERFLGGNVILAKGDQSGTGQGATRARTRLRARAF
jgi:hypothetical protein